MPGRITGRGPLQQNTLRGKTVILAAPGDSFAPAVLPIKPVGGGPPATTGAAVGKLGDGGTAAAKKGAASDIAARLGQAAASTATATSAPATSGAAAGRIGEGAAQQSAKGGLGTTAGAAGPRSAAVAAKASAGGSSGKLGAGGAAALRKGGLAMVGGTAGSTATDTAQHGGQGAASGVFGLAGASSATAGSVETHSGASEIRFGDSGTTTQLKGGLSSSLGAFGLSGSSTALSQITAQRESAEPGGIDGGTQKRGIRRDAAPVYPWYNKPQDKIQEISADYLAIHGEQRYDSSVGEVAPIGDVASHPLSAKPAPDLQSVESGIRLTQRALKEITSATALKARQRQDEEAAMLMMLALMMDDD